jgi:hypothetical protein
MTVLHGFEGEFSLDWFVSPHLAVDLEIKGNQEAV